MKPQRVLVTGGAGFVGTNVADRMLRAGHAVTVLDDLSRPGVDRNLAWLRDQHPHLTFRHGDVRDPAAIRAALEGCGHVFHLAAQTAVTTSVAEPRKDFAVNLAGTLNLLEEARRLDDPPSVLFTSTNKVYGALDGTDLFARDGRYRPDDPALAARGVNEAQPLRFVSPYGCSKGGADQYVLDYAASYGLRTVVFRMSCIYGRHQQGNEDQGWVAHFVRRALEGRTVTVYGDGMQVRDILYVDDLVDAMLLAWADIGTLAGRAFNIGGGPGNAVSLREVVAMISALHGRPVEVAYEGWRVGDQRWYVSDSSGFARATGWTPRIGTADGVRDLVAWMQANTPAVAEAG